MQVSWGDSSSIYFMPWNLFIFAWNFISLGHSHVGLLLTTEGGGGGGDLSCKNELAFLTFHLLVFEKCMCKSREKEEVNVS